MDFAPQQPPQQIATNKILHQPQETPFNPEHYDEKTVDYCQNILLVLLKDYDHVITKLLPGMSAQEIEIRVKVLQNGENSDERQDTDADCLKAHELMQQIKTIQQKLSKASKIEPPGAIINCQVSDNDELLIGNDLTNHFPPCAEKFLKQLITMAKMSEETGSVDSQSLLKHVDLLQFHLLQESQLRSVVEQALQECKIGAQHKDTSNLQKLKSDQERNYEP